MAFGSILVRFSLDFGRKNILFDFGSIFARFWSDSILHGGAFGAAWGVQEQSTVRSLSLL